MTIACISTSRLPSSTANSIQMMKACHALAQLSEPVRLFVPENDAPAAERSWERLADQYGLQQPFEICWLKSRSWLKRYDFAWEAVRQARKSGAHIIYTWTPQAALLALRARIPTILEVHDRPGGRIGPWLYRQFMKTPGQKLMLVITEALRQKLVHQFGAEMEKVDVQIAPNGVDLAQYAGLLDAPAARRQLGLPEMPSAAYTGHFYPGRGTDLLCQLARRFPQVQFLWIGGRDEDVTDMKARLAGEKIENVALTGFVSQRSLPLYQSAAEILLMPYERAIAGSSGGNSAEICSPMKMFDYLAAGRAILTSDLPVFHEVLNDQNAAFAEPEDVGSWSMAFEKLLADVPYRKSLSAQAQEDAKKYTWQERARRAVKRLNTNNQINK